MIPTDSLPSLGETPALAGQEPARAGVASAWQRAATAPLPRSARALWQQLRLPLTVTAGLSVTHFFSALTIMMQQPWPRIALTLAVIFAPWFMATSLQQFVLRMPWGRRVGGPAQQALQFFAMWSVGAAAVQAFNRSTVWFYFNASSVDTRAMLMFSIWNSALSAALLLAADISERRHRAAGERLLQLQREQLATRRRIVEGEMQAIQARVNPALFFDMLDTVQQLYRRDAARAEALLDELIAFLRAALPRLRDTSSTLAQELALAASYLRLRALAGRGSGALSIDVMPGLGAQAFPAGMLLPLLTALSDNAPLRLQACRDEAGGGLMLTLRSQAVPPPESTQRIADSLSLLYGSRAGLTVGADAPLGARICLTIPDDPD